MAEEFKHQIVQGSEQAGKKSVDSKKADAAIKALWEAMDEREGIVGLCAPQIGIFEKVLVVRIPESHAAPEEGADGEAGEAGAEGAKATESGVKEKRTAFVNPVILETSGPEVSQPESCLSYQEQGDVIVPRAHTVKVKDDKNGEQTLEGFEARVFLHMIDHFEGECAVDTLAKVRTVGRNDPCICGSGKKYKKCCG